MTTQLADLIGLSELGDLFGVSKDTANGWRRRGDFPKPVLELRMGPMWDRNEVLAWRSPVKRVHMDIQIECQHCTGVNLVLGFDADEEQAENRDRITKGKMSLWCTNCLRTGRTYNVAIRPGDEIHLTNYLTITEISQEEQ